MIKDKKLKSLKVLLVEDEEKIAELLKNALCDNFRSFLVAHDGLEGFDLYSKTSPDIIITDIMMPLSTGLEMAKKIREIDKNIPIIILSAFSEKEKLFAAIDAGVTKYFTKPYDPDEILEYIINIASSIEEKLVKLENDFTFNTNTSSLYKGKEFIPLGKKETKLISCLLNANDKFLRYDEIKSSIWKEEDISDDRLRTFIKRFREKTSKSFIRTLKGIGYKLSEN